MTVIMGRMSAYAGRAPKWDWAMKDSKLNLSPKKLKHGRREWATLRFTGKWSSIISGGKIGTWVFGGLVLCVCAS